MAKNDNRIKSSEVRKLLENGKYKTALPIVESINMEKIKNSNDFNIFADVYIKTGKYEKAMDMLLRVYEEFPGRKVIYRLVLVSIKKGDLHKAEDFYNEYVKKYPESLERWILRYRIEKAKREDYSVRIKSLERLKREDYIEEWAYELAKLYHKAGMEDKCVDECNDIIVWFGEGMLVEKARLLRDYYLEGRDIISGGEKEQTENPKNTLFMNTSDLGEQIAEIEKQEKNTVLRKELAEELKPTTNIQAAIKRDLGLTDDLQVQTTITRMLREQEAAGKKKAVIKKKRVEEENESVIREEENTEYREPEEAVAEPEAEYEEITEVLEVTGYDEASEEVVEKPVYQEVEEVVEEPVYQEVEEVVEEKEYEEAEETVEEPAYEEVTVHEEPEENSPIEPPAIDLEEAFGRFIRDKAVGEQLTSAFQKITTKQAPFHFVITGEDRENSMLLAKRIAKLLCQMGYIKTPRVAKIRGKNLNGMDLKGNWGKLKNGTIYIEGASELYTPTVRAIDEMVKNIGNEIVIILGDEAEAAEIMMEENYQFRDIFKHIIAL